MNTTMEFTVYSSASLVDDAEALINSLEDELSVTKDTSEIAQINQNGSGTVTGSTADLMGKALAMCSRTNGTLDISVYPIVRAWGFTTGSYKVPSEEELTSLLPLVDYTNVQYDEVTGEVILLQAWKSTSAALQRAMPVNRQRNFCAKRASPPHF